MLMLGFDDISPGRDGAFENDIIAHEYGHGVSSRLTGGSHNAICLQTLESRGMGEGWSDFFAYWTEMKASDNFTKNAEICRYAAAQWNNEEHKIGEIWATMLYEVYWSFVNKLGFQQNKYSPTFQRIIPCNPTFLQARDAMLQAEQQLTGGKHACEIWRGFAKRGLGYKAASQDLTRRPILAYHPT
ncbi:hypothetical protein BDF19DRAFT_432849, partial [Syncephalis fuscata]